MDLMVELLQWSFTKLPKHWKVVSHWQDDQECNAEIDCWKMVKLAISGMEVGMLEGVVMMMMMMMMMMPTEGIEGTKKVLCISDCKKLEKNNLMVKNWMRDSNDCDAEN